MRKMTGYGIVGLLLVLALALTGCGRSDKAEHQVQAAVSKAVAVLHPTEGNNVRGTVTFTKEEKGIRVMADIQGLSPGLHGFHVHEFGDCSAPDGKTAGEHFNPGKAPHGGPTAEKRHVGDLGNIQAGESGPAKYDVIDPMISFEGPNSILGRSVVVHIRADDLNTQPAGGAGARLACGVIGVVSK